MKAVLLGLLKRVGLYEIIAFVTGFVLMAYELAASRILAPTIGTSIYVWTSVIGVMIAALAVGYAVGGWIADKRGKAQEVVWLLMAAALGVAFTCIFYGGVLSTVVTITGDTRIQGVLAAALLFAPASFTLGTISPYLAKLRISSLRTTGRSVAALSALNSVGGITGTFLAGFVFFNYIGSQQTLALLAVILLACSWAIQPRRQIKERLGVSAAAVLILVLQIATLAAAGTIAEVDTATSHYKIIDTTQNGRETRVLVMGPGGWQSGVYTSGEKNELVFSYTRALAEVVRQAPHKDTILVLGGGAFTLPEYLGRQYPDSTVDVVEIDPRLPEIARQYFRYQPTDNIHVLSEDARTYLRTSQTRYDIVIVDVYNDIGVPFSLASREYVDGLKKTLAPDGIIAANVIAAATDSCLPLLSSVNSTYRTAFGNARIYPLVDPANRVKQNIIAVYGNTSLDWLPTAGLNTAKIPAGRVLTDNFAPTEHLIQQCED